MVTDSFLQTKINPEHHLRLQKILLEENYKFLTVSVKNDTLLTCEGAFRPSNFSTTYRYRINYTCFSRPTVNVITPFIQYNDDIHMYKDKSLCLYFPIDNSWTNTSLIYQTIVPWTHEWFVFYELYKITGKWHHPYVDHRRIRQ